MPKTELARDERGRVLTKFTPEVEKSIVKLVKDGTPLSSAAPLSGVHTRTVMGWLAEGEDNPDGEYGEFALEVRAAQAKHKQEMLQMVKDAAKAGPQYWTAAMTILERLYPDEFRRPSEKQNVTVNVGILEKRVHELSTEAEAVYTGG